MKFGNENFSFEVFTEDTVAIKNLLTGKGSASVSIMKEAIDAYCPKVTQIMNYCLKNNFFLDTLKNGEITPCFKKGDDCGKEIYRPVSILSSFSKVFERLLYNKN